MDELREGKDAGDIAAAGLICELVRDVDDECEYADRLALELEKRDTSYAVCERLAWLCIVRDHLKKPTVDATVTEPRITDELTGSEFLKAASSVDYAALMGTLDNHMSQIHALR